MANGTIQVEDLFDKADALADEREKTLEAQAAIRETLRNLDKAGMLSKKESDRLAEIFPVRTRNRDAEDEGVE